MVWCRESDGPLPKSITTLFTNARLSNKVLATTHFLTTQNAIHNTDVRPSHRYVYMPVAVCPESVFSLLGRRKW